MIDRRLAHVNVGDFPSWPCPICRVGSLQRGDKPVSRWPHAGVAHAIDEGFIEHSDDRGVFSTTLHCSNSACHQGVAILGDYSCHLIDNDYRQMAVDTIYRVRDIHPAILLIDFSDKLTPEPIAGALHRSFSLYWRDPQSCAVAIRTAIEGIAGRLGQAAKQNGKFVSLEKRLSNLNAQHTDAVEAAKAIKDIGNDGAHGDEVDRDKLLNAYELLEIELRSLFNDDLIRRQELITRLKS
jgi:hypothetical protein